MFYLLDISGFCISEMIYIMKKEEIFWASVCLLLCCASVPLNAVPEEGEEHGNVTGEMLEIFF